MALVDNPIPPVHANGLQRIRESWKKPSDSVTALSPWPKDFSQGITPARCHSHNDYWRKVPLFDALTAGCVGVEADVWLDKTSNDLLVGHRTSSLSAERTLQSLYIKPLTIILTRINQGVNYPAPRSGVFETLPNASLTLLIDVKTDGHTTWPVVMDQLAPLRAGGWLSYWNKTGDGLAWRPIIVVGTGNTPFELVNAGAEYRDVFFDAPLGQLADNASFTANNSYYASASLRKAAGTFWPWGPSRRQKETMKRMIDTAAARGLVSRFWDIPGWPVNRRTKPWRFLIESGIGILNVDELFEARQWIRDWCTVAGRPWIFPYVPNGSPPARICVSSSLGTKSTEIGSAIALRYLGQFVLDVIRERWIPTFVPASDTDADEAPSEEHRSNRTIITSESRGLIRSKEQQTSHLGSCPASRLVSQHARRAGSRAREPGHRARRRHGLLSMFCAKHLGVQSVVATDREPALIENIHGCMRRNELDPAVFHPAIWEWGTPLSLTQSKPKGDAAESAAVSGNGDLAFDVALGADLVSVHDRPLARGLESEISIDVLTVNQSFFPTSTSHTAELEALPPNPFLDQQHPRRVMVQNESPRKSRSPQFSPRTSTAVSHHNYDPDRSFPHSRGASEAYFKYAVLFFAASIITWVPSSANRVYALAASNHYVFGLSCASSFALPLQGFWNSLVYITVSWQAILTWFRHVGAQARRTSSATLGSLFSLRLLSRGWL
ncbi:altered inheritance of mitochondria protein 6 homolog ARB_06966 [Aspergillus lentulus]|uniref:Altered inheritance of mitochondria protein 6 n=1 Tax=Aspergillus lentulus TaxID=293939 RepID=A0ABQ1AFK5_ASPLE|nr:altered inheritance of mitochondria protein 6 homolog ARB_06966 [Aspergillus lentulus]GFF80946.1 altered inheritance of mitochondria protein 6 homolog ARB_06966 [Aspergillus lentulus]